ncbi:hypothetical protein ACJJTC_017908 [Scirpophaga incertulas]
MDHNPVKGRVRKYSAVVSPIEVEPTNDEIEVQAIHTPPIDKELKNELMTKHVAFENISMLPPKLNPEKVAAVSEPVKKRDLIIAERQKQEIQTVFCFLSDLSEKIKITKAVQKSVKDLRINASNKPTITPKTKSLNWRAPPRSSARTVTGGRQNLPKQHQKEDRKHRQPFRNIHTTRTTGVRYYLLYRQLEDNH